MHSYLANNHRPRSRNALKLGSALSVIIALGALSIWAFTPVSEEANYKLDRPIISNSITTNSDTSPQTLVASAARDEEQVIQPPLNSDIDKLILDTQGDAYLELRTITLPESAQITGSEEIEPKSTPTAPNIELAAIAPAPPAGAKLERQPEAEPTAEAKPEPAEKQRAITASEVPTPPTIDSGRVKTFEIKSGDTLTRIFKNADLPISQAIILSKSKEASKLNRLSIGKTLRIYYDQNQQLASLQYDIDKLNTLMVTPKEGKFDVYTLEKQVEYRTFTAQGTIESSLGAAAEIAGMSAGVANDLIDIYKWEIDFARDLQKGDHFSVIYQKAFIDDEYIANGPVLAASFTTGGRTIEALRYTDSNGVVAYFQPNGESLRRGFLRSPISGVARITSRFGKRLHPIKKIWKQHKGVDYGASRGTPIVATADGVIQYAGKKGGYGNAVILRHGGIYTTLYAHMSKIGKGVRSGKNVTQGQIIGYVGHSGWATGDHLHYEFRVNGQHKDPLKVKLPKTLPLAKQERKAFDQQANTLLAELESIKGTRVATLESDPNKPAL